MPKRTKEKKRLADERRKILLSQNTPESIKEKRHQKKARKDEYNETDYDRQLRRFTLQDMGLTLIITIIILAIQGVLLYAYFNGISPADILSKLTG